MRLTSTVIAFSLALANAQTDFPSCIQNCIQDNPTSSTCTGEETGQDLADCTCDSLRGSGLLDCMSDCSPEDQTDYADILDGACKNELFPDASDDSSDDDADETSDDGPSQTSGGSGSQETNESGDDSDDNDDAASGVSAPLILAVGGVVAAFFM